MSRFACLVLFSLVACAPEESADTCATSSECASDERCLNGFCVERRLVDAAGEDAPSEEDAGEADAGGEDARNEPDGAPMIDSGTMVDAGTTTDTGVDTGPTIEGMDAGPDAGTDTGPAPTCPNLAGDWSACDTAGCPDAVCYLANTTITSTGTCRVNLSATTRAYTILGDATVAPDGSLTLLPGFRLNNKGIERSCSGATYGSARPEQITFTCGRCSLQLTRSGFTE
jgi:hypothetical protein